MPPNPNTRMPQRLQQTHHYQLHNRNHPHSMAYTDNPHTQSERSPQSAPYHRCLISEIHLPESHGHDGGTRPSAPRLMISGSGKSLWMTGLLPVTFCTFCAIPALPFTANYAPLLQTIANSDFLAVLLHTYGFAEKHGCLSCRLKTSPFRQ